MDHRIFTYKVFTLFMCFCNNKNVPLSFKTIFSNCHTGFTQKRRKTKSFISSTENHILLTSIDFYSKRTLKLKKCLNILFVMMYKFSISICNV